MNQSAGRPRRSRCAAVLTLVAAMVGAAVGLHSCRSDPGIVDPLQKPVEVNAPTESRGVPRANAPVATTGSTECGCRVLDLYDGKPVSGVEFLPPDRSLPVRSDESGQLRLPRHSLTDANRWRVLSPEWRIGGFGDAAALGDGMAELWIYREVRVRGRVSLGGPPPAKWTYRRVRLKVVAVSKSLPPTGTSARARLTHTVAREFQTVRPSDGGTFEFVAPNVPGVEVTASTAGWLPDRRKLEDGARDAEGSLSIDFRLDPAPSVRGRCVTAEANALSGVDVDVFVVFDEEASSVSSAELRARFPGGGVTAEIGPETARVAVRHRGRTDGEGRFSIPVVARGEVFVVAYARGHAAARTRWASDVESASERDLVVPASPAPDSKVRILLDGSPLPQVEIGIADLSSGFRFHPAWSAKSDSQGDVSACWFEWNHRYAIVPIPAPDQVKSGLPGPGNLTWSGQAVIELRTLEPAVDDVR